MEDGDVMKSPPIINDGRKEGPEKSLIDGRRCAIVMNTCQGVNVPSQDTRKTKIKAQ
jgi:hypothetical protein